MERAVCRIKCRPARCPQKKGRSLDDETLAQARLKAKGNEASYELTLGAV
jgi:hypothetical protein